MACYLNTLGVLILSRSFTFSVVGGETCDLYAAVGQMLSLPLEYKALGEKDVLRWTHNNSVVFYRQPGRVIGKPGDITTAGSLQLRNLDFSSAGVYKADVLNENNTRVKGWTGRVCVMDKVSKPRLRFVCESGADAVMLTCDSPKPGDVAYAWSLHGNALKAETKSTLRVSLSKLTSGKNITCSIKNIVSLETSDPVRITCERSQPASPVTYCFEARTVMAVLVGGGCLILLLLIISISLCCQCTNTASSDQRVDLQMTPSANQHKPDPEHMYETMNPSGVHGSPGPRPKPSPSPRVNEQAVLPSAPMAQEMPSHVTAELHVPSPVPKPRTKMPQTT